MRDHTKTTSCDCFKAILERAETDLTERKIIPTGASEVRVRWEHGVLVLGGSEDNCPVAIPLEAEFRLTKTDGTPYRSKTRKQVNVFPSFCPFCGRKYKREKADD